MERKDSNYKGSPIRLLAALQAETPEARREQKDALKVLKD